MTPANQTLCFHWGCNGNATPAATTHCPRCGQPLLLRGRYRCGLLLGSGARGRTFLAVDQSRPSHPCVIRQTPVLREAAAFQQWLATLQALGHHPQLPALLDGFEEGFEEGACQYWVQESMAGPSLEQILTLGPLPSEQVVLLLRHLLPMLQEIHAAGLIHRDIKPANIIWPAPDQPPVLVDFGAAVEAAAEMTPAGAAGYAAPEQVLGQAVYASDLYSLGATGLQLLTGLHPFELYSVATERWQWRPYVQSPVPVGLARLLERMVARSLDRRYGSAAAVLADLKAVITSRPQPAAPLPPWQLRRTLEVHAVAVDLAVSPDGRGLAVAGSNGTLQLWDLASGEHRHSFTQGWGGLGRSHRDVPVAVRFHPDGHTLVSASRDGEICWWDLRSYQRQHRQQQPGWALTALALTPDGTQLIGGGADGRLFLWSWSGELQGRLSHPAAAITALEVSPNGGQLLSASEDSTLRVWQLPAGRLAHTLSLSCPATACTWQGEAVLYGEGNQLWRWAPPQRPQTLAKLDAIQQLQTAPTGEWIAIARAAAVELWDGAGRRRQHTLPHGWSVGCLVRAPIGLVSAAADERVYLWQPAEPARAPGYSVDQSKYS